MAKKFKDWGKGKDTYRRFVMQKALVEKHFPLFKCSFNNRELTCIGKIKPAEGCETYTVQIRYRSGGKPKVHVLNPSIDWNENIHMYHDGSLCLYYPPETPWKHTSNLHETIIPWTAEWLVFYELYLLTGVWEGESAPHPICDLEG